MGRKQHLGGTRVHRATPKRGSSLTDLCIRVSETVAARRAKESIPNLRQDRLHLSQKSRENDLLRKEKEDELARQAARCETEMDDYERQRIRGIAVVYCPWENDDKPKLTGCREVKSMYPEVADQPVNSEGICCGKCAYMRAREILNY